MRNLTLALFFLIAVGNANAQSTAEYGSLGLASLLRYGDVAEELDMAEEQRFDLDDLWLSVEDQLQEAKRTYRCTIRDEQDEAILKQATASFKQSHLRDSRSSSKAWTLLKNKKPDLITGKQKKELKELEGDPFEFQVAKTKEDKADSKQTTTSKETETNKKQ